MAIDQTDIVNLADAMLPEANTLDCKQLHTLANAIISELPDDGEDHRSEVLCKLLQSAAFLNKSKAAVDISGLKKEKTGDVEIEYSERNIVNVWDKYLDSLKDLCPRLPYGGYTGLTSAIGISICPGDPIVVNPCPDIYDETYL